MVFKRILVINPNSSKPMTDALDILIRDLNQEVPTPIAIDTYTAPSGPPSINNEEDALVSALVVIEDLGEDLSKYDAYLVACYSVHPLVSMLREKCPPQIHVTGIFEASVSLSLALLPLDPTTKKSKFGIVSTGTYWENALSEGVRSFLGSKSLESGRFKGVETTGLNAMELHTSSADEVRKKMMDATKRLVRHRDVKVVCLGCAGMAGMDGIVKDALVEELGESEAGSIHILDGVRAGIGLLEGLLKALPGEGR
jgi:Asp/Glu/hydantoin racemase